MMENRKSTIGEAVEYIAKLKQEITELEVALRKQMSNRKDWEERIKTDTRKSVEIMHKGLEDTRQMLLSLLNQKIIILTTEESEGEDEF